MSQVYQFLPIIIMMLLSFLRYSGDETRGPMPGEQRYFSLTVRAKRDGTGSSVRRGRCTYRLRESLDVLLQLLLLLSLCLHLSRFSCPPLDHVRVIDPVFTLCYSTSRPLRIPCRPS
jgi:hypothetical protein